MRRVLPCVFFLCVLLASPRANGADGPAPAGGSKLTVLVVFDQLRGDYLQKWNKLLGEGGFKRLEAEGAAFTQCHYPYAFTLTAPGHASMITGCSPAKHGVILNEWYDRGAGAPVSSVTPPPDRRGDGPGPYRRRQESVGDTLLRHLQKAARVFSFAIKDRGAILLSALRPQGVYWFEVEKKAAAEQPTHGHFVTSRYYGDPAGWVTRFNAARRAERWLGKSWQKLRGDVDYVAHAGDDDHPAEGTGPGGKQGRAFPHPYGSEPTVDYFGAMLNSPAGNELLLEFALQGLDAEKIGTSGTSDLLCLGFSSNDLVGHCWGPDSHEVLDMTLRTDALIKALLDALDSRVGAGRYTLVVCSDHGVAPLPEVSAAQGRKAERIPYEMFGPGLQQALNEGLGREAPWLIPLSKSPLIYFNRETLAEHGIPFALAEGVAARWLKQQRGIQAVYTRTQLLASAPLDAAGEAARKSFYPDRSPDVIAVVEPYCLIGPNLPRGERDPYPAYHTSHGTPHDYDTHVPLLVFGPGVTAGPRRERVTPLAVAPILAAALGIPAPDGAEAGVPAGLFQKK